MLKARTHSCRRHDSDFRRVEWRKWSGEADDSWLLRTLAHSRDCYLLDLVVSEDSWYDHRVHTAKNDLWAHSAQQWQYSACYLQLLQRVLTAAGRRTLWTTSASSKSYISLYHVEVASWTCWQNSTSMLWVAYVQLSASIFNVYSDLTPNQRDRKWKTDELLMRRCALYCPKTVLENKGDGGSDQDMGKKTMLLSMWTTASASALFLQVALIKLLLQE